jgi:hypothetical protein
VLHNVLVLILQIFVTSAVSLFCLRLGEKALNSWLCLLAIAMNLFILKQVTILTFAVTSTDALAIGYFFGLSLIQEYFGKEAARRHILLSICCTIAFMLISFVQLLYRPNNFDNSHHVFVALLTPMPRIFLASLFSFLLIQFLDVSLFQKLRLRWSGRWFTGRVGICLIISQIIDTVIFTYLALYRLMPSLLDVIVFSLAIKLFIIIASLPFVSLSHKVQKRTSSGRIEYGRTKWIQD